MMKKVLLITSLLLSTALQASPDPARQQELEYLLLQDCGACHGLTLKGGLGPSLLPHSLGDKSRKFLSQTILYGRPGTAMPAWQMLLSADDADWLAQRLLRGTP